MEQAPARLQTSPVPAPGVSALQFPHPGFHLGSTSVFSAKRLSFEDMQCLRGCF